MKFSWLTHYVQCTVLIIQSVYLLSQVVLLYSHFFFKNSILAEFIQRQPIFQKCILPLLKPPYRFVSGTSLRSWVWLLYLRAHSHFAILMQQLALRQSIHFQEWNENAQAAFF